jgi:hypothetical protein
VHVVFGALAFWGENLIVTTVLLSLAALVGVLCVFRGVGPVLPGRSQAGTSTRASRRSRLLTVLLGVALLSGSVSILAFERDRARKAGGVVCDRFDLIARVDGASIVLSIDTDLPDSAGVIVSVDRLYWRAGGSSAYPIDYFVEKSTVKQWRQPRRVSIASSDWKKALQGDQADLARVGYGFSVSSISDNVEASATIHINQPDPRFGDENKNLTGRAVPENGMRVIHDEVVIPFPL